MNIGFDPNGPKRILRNAKNDYSDTKRKEKKEVKFSIQKKKGGGGGGKGAY